MASAKTNTLSNIEEMLSNQINAELIAAYAYSSMAFFFSKDNVALHGFANYFKEASGDSLEKARKIVKYMSLRGANITCKDISAPQEWDNSQKIVNTALDIEKHLYSRYLAICKAADESNDPELQDFIQSIFMKTQSENIKELADLCTTLNRVASDGTGLFLLDRDIATKLKICPSEARPKMPTKEN